MAYRQEPKSPVLKRCWEGYSPVPGKKKEEKGSCAKSPAKRTKPHKAGMSAAERKTYNNKTGGNLKAPQPGGGSRKKSANGIKRIRRYNRKNYKSNWD